VRFAGFKDAPAGGIRLTGILQFLCHIHFDPAQTVDDIFEAIVVHHHVFIRADAKIDLESLRQQLKPTQSPDGIDAIRPVTRNSDVKIAWEGYQADGFLFRINRGQDDHIRAEIVGPKVIHAQQKNVQLVLRQLTYRDNRHRRRSENGLRDKLDGAIFKDIREGIRLIGSGSDLIMPEADLVGGIVRAGHGGNNNACKNDPDKSQGYDEQDRKCDGLMFL